MDVALARRIAILLSDDPDTCECGGPLDHPVAAPRPLRSWMSRKSEQGPASAPPPGGRVPITIRPRGA